MELVRCVFAWLRCVHWVVEHYVQKGFLGIPRAFHNKVSVQGVAHHASQHQKKRKRNEATSLLRASGGCDDTVSSGHHQWVKASSTHQSLHGHDRTVPKHTCTDMYTDADERSILLPASGQGTTPESLGAGESRFTRRTAIPHRQARQRMSTPRCYMDDMRQAYSA